MDDRPSKLTSRQRVVVLDAPRSDYLSEVEIESGVLAAAADVELCVVAAPSEAYERLRQADAVIVWHAVPIGAHDLEQMVQCRGIVVAASGFDNVDVAAAAANGIPVYNLPDYGEDELADHAFAMLLALVRNLPGSHQDVLGGAWRWRAIGSVPRLRGARLGLQGFGRSGRAMARRASAFGIQVGYFDPARDPESNPNSDPEQNGDVADPAQRFPSLEALLDWAHFLSIHAPLSPATQGSIGDDAFERLGEGALLVNVARGGIVDEAALLRALGSGRLAGAGLDVLANEPEVPDALRQHPRVLLSAHAGWYSDPVLPELRRSAAEVALGVLRNEPPARVAVAASDER